MPSPHCVYTIPLEGGSKFVVKFARLCRGAVVASLSMSTKTTQKPVQNRTGRTRSNVPAGVPLNKFARWMRTMKLEVEEVAKMIGVSVSSVYGYRRGNRPPSRKVAKVIEKVTKKKVPAGSWD